MVVPCRSCAWSCVEWRLGGCHDRAECEGDVHLAVEADVAEAAAVGAAADGFELVDDLHGADLGCARDRADWERGAERVPAVEPFAERARHGAADVHDVAVAFYFHDAWERDRAGLGDDADVVAAKVHEHDVLGAFLGVGEELALEACVVGGVLAPAACACEGAVGDFEAAGGAADAAEDLGAAGDQDAALGLDIGHVGAWIDGAKGAIDIEGVGWAWALEALAEDDLEDVARGDVLLGAGDHRCVLLAREVAGEGRGGCGGRRGHLAGAEGFGVRVEEVDGARDGGEGAVVRRGGIGVGLTAGFNDREFDDVHGALRVIEDDEARVETKVQVREGAVVARGAGEGKLVGLCVAHAVVRRVTDPAAEEARGRAGREGEPHAARLLTHDGEGVGAGLGPAA